MNKDLLKGSGSALGGMLEAIDLEKEYNASEEESTSVLDNINKMFNEHNAGKTSNIDRWMKPTTDFKQKIEVTSEFIPSKKADIKIGDSETDRVFVHPNKEPEIAIKRICDIPSDILISYLYGDIMLAINNDWVTVDSNFKSISEKPIIHKIDDKNIFLVFREIAFDVSTHENIAAYTHSVQKLIYSKNNYLKHSLKFINNKIAEELRGE